MSASFGLHRLQQLDTQMDQAQNRLTAIRQTLDDVRQRLLKLPAATLPPSLDRGELLTAIQHHLEHACREFLRSLAEHARDAQQRIEQEQRSRESEQEQRRACAGAARGLFQPQ